MDTVMDRAGGAVRVLAAPAAGASARMRTIERETAPRAILRVRVLMATPPGGSDDE
jgi:hypothetical protein